MTGTCAHPPHLRGVEVQTLHIEDFKCGEFDPRYLEKTPPIEIS